MKVITENVFDEKNLINSKELKGDEFSQHKMYI